MPQWSCVRASGWLVLAVGLHGCSNSPVVDGLRCSGPWAQNCVAQSQLPEDQDAIIRWLWAHYRDGSDSDVHQAITRLSGLVSQSQIDDGKAGTMDALARDDLAAVEMTSTDPSTTTGLLLMDAMDCTVEQAQRITLFSNQAELYPGVFETYVRTFLTSEADFRAGTTSQVAWTVESTGTLLQSHYSMKYGGGDRLVPAQEGSAATGPVLLNRSWLREPAHFDDTSRAMDQDYQIEAYWERAPGKVVHLWATWRQIKMGSFTNNDQVVLEILLNNMEDWDRQTRKLCAENRPPPP